MYEDEVDTVIPPFSGCAREDVYAWIRRLEYLALAEGWSNHALLYQACAALTGQAARWLDTQPCYEWECFKQSILLRFSLGVDALMSEFHSIRQARGESAAQYADRFSCSLSRLASLNACLSPVLTLRCFVQGLRRSLQRTVIDSHPASFEEARDMATYTEEYYLSNDRFRYDSTVTAQSGDNYMMQLVHDASNDMLPFATGHDQNCHLSAEIHRLECALAQIRLCHDENDAVNEQDYACSDDVNSSSSVISDDCYSDITVCSSTSQISADELLDEWPPASDDDLHCWPGTQTMCITLQDCRPTSTRDWNQHQNSPETSSIEQTIDIHDVMAVADDTKQPASPPSQLPHVGTANSAPWYQNQDGILCTALVIHPPAAPSEASTLHQALSTSRDVQPFRPPGECTLIEAEVSTTGADFEESPQNASGTATDFLPSAVLCLQACLPDTCISGNDACTASVMRSDQPFVKHCTSAQQISESAWRTHAQNLNLADQRSSMNLQFSHHMPNCSKQQMVCMPWPEPDMTYGVTRVHFMGSYAGECCIAAADPLCCPFDPGGSNPGPYG